jgi:hypothetical protein
LLIVIDSKEPEEEKAPREIRALDFAVKQFFV